MANSVSQQNPPTDSPATAVVLIPSARFITRSEVLPTSVRARDVIALLEGLIEENSPLPIDHVSWGFLSEGKTTSKERRVFTYCAAKDLVFGSARRKTPQRPTLPAFAALYGIKVREPGWVFLADEVSLAAVLLRPNQSLPARIHARFLTSSDEEGLWEARTRLVSEIKPSKGEKLLPGIVRVGNLNLSGNRLEFQLTRLPSAGANWENWQQTRLVSQAAINNADLRERALLQAQQEKQRSGRSLKLAALVLVLAIAAIAFLEALLYSRSAVAAELTEQVEEQKGTVKSIQQMEAMTKALEATLQRKARPFDLLSVLNRKRPENLYVKTMAYGEADQLRIGGEADNIQTVNNYTAALREDDFWLEVDLAEVRTETSGAATFQLRLKANKDKPIPPQPPATATETPANTTEAPAT